MARIKVYHKRGGAELVVADGGKITVESGGTLEAAAGSTITGLTGQTTFASDAQAITGTLTDKVLSPKNLAAAATTHVAAASATAAGKVELATDAEALAGADTERAVTPHGLAGAILKMDIISFAGKNNTGACTATGLKVSDIILSVTGVAAADKGDQSANFESVVTVADQIQQSAAGDLSTKVYMALIFRQS